MIKFSITLRLHSETCIFSLYAATGKCHHREHQISFHSYADDAQLSIELSQLYHNYISLSPSDIGPVDKLVQCIDHINLWMSHHFFQLHKDKKEVLIIGAKRESYWH